MGHSSYRWNPQIGEHLLPGTKANGSPRFVVRLQQPVAAFSLYTTVDDYARFLIALLHDQELLDRIADSPVDVDPRLNLSWGLGWGIEQPVDGAHLWKWGTNPGYGAFVMVILINGDGGLKLAEPLVGVTMPRGAQGLSGAILDGWRVGHTLLCPAPAHLTDCRLSCEIC